MLNLFRSKSEMMSVSMAWLVVILGMGVRFWLFETPLEKPIGETVSLSTLILVKPELRYSHSLWHDQGYTIECPLRIEVCNQVAAGDRLAISGVLKAPWYPGWFSRPRLVVKSVEQLNWERHARHFFYSQLIRFLAHVRDRVNLIFVRSLEQPQAGLLAGIVMGERALLPEEFNDALSNTGTMHVIAASGYNVSVIALVSVSLLTLVMSRKASILMASLLVCAYAILAGGNPAIVRAAIMGLLAYAAQFMGREYIAHNSLVLTVLVMLIGQPWLIHDLSFALSLCATWGIIWGTPALERLFKRIKKITKPTARDNSAELSAKPILQTLVATGLSTTLAATLATLPLSVIVFGQATLIAPLVNAVVLWLISPLMALGGLMAVFGLASQSIASGLAIVAHPLLSLFIALIELGSRVPFSAIPLSGIHWTVGLGYWLLLASWWHGSGINNPKRR